RLEADLGGDQEGRVKGNATMLRTIAIATVLAITLVVGTFTATGGGAYAATLPIGQDVSTGPYNPGIPSD
ncbi:MAG: hypothetical protein ACAH24_23325, partial [Hyphomicrobiaceae bacterium]